ncbi:uncharacterized protein TEOVI_000328600 [Trypanosoma equiperdum]|uniref:Uncharacterized protein n=1 Tax=Trypanosoma equiperdum TaxID=5694 RepID=A0A1G4IHH9_TRYEQ|nr:hypothetical protein TEOVI_000328600 [Trypanosoma equiperdum]
MLSALYLRRYVPVSSKGLRSPDGLKSAASRHVAVPAVERVSQAQQNAIRSPGCRCSRRHMLSQFLSENCVTDNIFQRSTLIGQLRNEVPEETGALVGYVGALRRMSGLVFFITTTTICSSNSDGALCGNFRTYERDGLL